MEFINGTDMSGGIRYIRGGKGHKERDTYIEFDSLKAGTYCAYIEMDWNENLGKDDQVFNITNYGQGKTEFTDDVACSFEQIELLELLLKNKAEQRHENVIVTDIGHPKSPLITKFECTKSDEGYNFIVFENKEQEAVYTETVEFPNFKGLKLLESSVASITENSYEISVGPGETQIIIIQAAVSGFSMSSSMSTKLAHGDKALREMCLEDGKKNQKAGLEIYQYQLQHEAGMHYVFVNETTDKMYREDIKYQLAGLKIVG